MKMTASAIRVAEPGRFSSPDFFSVDGSGFNKKGGKITYGNGGKLREKKTGILASCLGFNANF